MEYLQQFILLIEQKNPVAIIAAIVVVIILFLLVKSIFKLAWKIVTFPFRVLFGTKKNHSKEISLLHRSKDWGGQAHVDLYERDKRGKVTKEKDHGHSPTLYPPPEEEGRIKIARKKDLPPPYGEVPD